MAWVLPEVTIRRVINDGMKALRTNHTAFVDIFSQFTQDELNAEYGAAYIEQIWQWFTTTKVPVVQSWALNVQKIPCISIHLANETEAEDKAALGDYGGIFDDTSETGVATFTAMIDIGLHANKGGDHVLWLYYIVSYIMFRQKTTFERFGIKLGTFSASDYANDNAKLGDNIWTRWVRYRCTTQNTWPGDPLRLIEEVDVSPKTGLTPDDVATSLDVDQSTLDTSVNTGFTVSSTDVDDDITW
jgi:hypothetical protein